MPAGQKKPILKTMPAVPAVAAEEEALPLRSPETKVNKNNRHSFTVPVFCRELEESMKKQIANLLTAFRMICSIGMLFCPVFSGWFYVWYLLGGLSDMIDGTIARKTSSVSEFGAKLDTAADLIFAVISFLKILPEIHLPAGLWCWILAIGVFKAGNYLWYFQENVQSLHTTANKITGFCLICLPLTLSVLNLQYSAPAVCGLATIAVVQELCLRRKALP